MVSDPPAVSSSCGDGGGMADVGRVTTGSNGGSAGQPGLRNGRRVAAHALRLCHFLGGGARDPFIGVGQRFMPNSAPPIGAAGSVGGADSRRQLWTARLPVIPIWSLPAGIRRVGSVTRNCPRLKGRLKSGESTEQPDTIVAARSVWPLSIRCGGDRRGDQWRAGRPRGQHLCSRLAGSAAGFFLCAERFDDLAQTQRRTHAGYQRARRSS